MQKARNWNLKTKKQIEWKKEKERKLKNEIKVKYMNDKHMKTEMNKENQAVKNININ